MANAVRIEATEWHLYIEMLYVHTVCAFLDTAVCYCMWLVVKLI